MLVLTSFSLLLRNYFFKIKYWYGVEAEASDRGGGAENGRVAFKNPPAGLGPARGTTN
jgi:hypothetical protein